MNMENTLNLLEKINWFLAPIADFIIYLFSTPTGIGLLIAGFAIYIIATIANAIHVRQLAHKAAKSAYGRGSIPFLERIYIVLSQTGKVALNTITKAPVLLGIFLFLLLIVGFQKNLEVVDTFIENEERKQQLTTVIKHLSQSYKVAEIEILEQEYDVSSQTTTTTLKIKYLDYAGMGIEEKTQTLSIEGKEIYFDAVMMNFEYSEIENGSRYNIVIPQRVFSNAVSAKDGKPLNIKDENGVPIFFKRNADDIYGISEADFNQRLKDIIGLLNNEEKARAAGVRTIVGDAVHLRVWKGYTLEMWVEQTGELTLKNTTNLF